MKVKRQPQLFVNRSSTTASAATDGHLSLRATIPLSSEGSQTACPSFLPGFWHQCCKVKGSGKKEAGSGEGLINFNHFNQLHETRDRCGAN